jgi:hypothetical protein
MASTYSNLKIQLMATGENSGTWGNVTNDNLGIALEEAIVGSEDVTFASGTVTLTLTNTNASQTARNLRLNLTGTSGGAQDLIVPAIEKVYIVNNGCADTITVKNNSGTGIAVPAGKTMWVYNNGTNVVDAVTHLTSLTLATALPVASGGTGSTTAAFSGANITSLNASNVSSGLLAVARGGTNNEFFTVSGPASSAKTYTFANENMSVGFRNVPPVGTKTTSYTLAVTDVGEYVQVGSGGSITIPDATFAEGDVISIFNNTSGNITITCTITTAYIAGTDSDKASVTLATRGVCTILFISGTVCVITGNVT